MVRRRLGILVAVVLGVSAAHGADSPPTHRVLPEGQLPEDRRLGPLKDRNGYFPFTPPGSPGEWSKRASEVRRRILVAAGLWPMAERQPSRAVVHGLVDRPEYTVEKVYLESYPGHFVTGSLYRPKNAAGPLPAIVSPHGHWPGGRFQESSLEEVRKQIATGAEVSEVNGRYPLQSRCVQLARMGCLVFLYDSVGSADSQQISFDDFHRLNNVEPAPETKTDWRLLSTQAELRMQSPFGLQTYNSLCVMDWICSLPEVDKSRIAATGASGGGSQSFILGAIDPRLTAMFPVVMVSTAMQGGCTCENACCLRVGTGNVEFAGLFAPRPAGMVSANDWTKEFATKGFPELKQLYTMLGAPDNVVEESHTEHPHNFNYVSRLAVYRWINRFFKLGQEEPIAEREFVPLTREEMTVWDESHPTPPSGPDYEKSLLRGMTESSDKIMADLMPREIDDLSRYRDVVGDALRVIIGRALPPASEISSETVRELPGDNWTETHLVVRYETMGEQIPVVMLKPKNWYGDVVLWLDGKGKQALFQADGQPIDGVATLLSEGLAVAGADLFMQGEFLGDQPAPTENRIVEGPRVFAGHTYGYNSPLLAQRVHDILSLVAFFQHQDGRAKHVSLVGVNGAGVWVGLARALIEDEEVQCTAIDTQGFRFVDVESWRDVNFLPGVVKYGDVPGLLALCGPHLLFVAGEAGGLPEVASQAYAALGASNRVTCGGDLDAAVLAKWLTLHNSAGE